MKKLQRQPTTSAYPLSSVSQDQSTASPMEPRRFLVLGVPVHATNLENATEVLEGLASERKRGTVIFRDVHGIVRAQRDPDLLEAHRAASLVCPDGMPLVKIGRRRGFTETRRTYGPDTMRCIMEASRHSGTTHFLFGGKPGVAEDLKEQLERDFPGVNIVGTHTPPFRDLTDREMHDLRKDLERLRPHYLWVGLSTPNQERFMHATSAFMPPTIMLGVGAAFDYLSNHVPESPAWIRRSGLQWLHRTLQEPRRLGKRYAVIVPTFLFLLLKEKVVHRPPPEK